MASKLIIDRIPPDMHVDENGNIVWTPRLIDFNSAVYSRGHVVTSDEFNTELIKQTYQGNYNTDTISVLIDLYNDLKTDVTNTVNTANTNAATALSRVNIAEANSIEALGTANDAFTTSTEALSDVQAAVNASVEAVTTSENALNISESAMSLAEDASDRADAAVLDAEEAMRIAEIADNMSVTAEEKAAQALSISQLASSTANSANTKSDNAVASANTAVETANEALNKVTAGLGTTVKVNGDPVSEFNADDKLDVTANAVSATKATQDGDGKVIQDTYTKLDGSNYLVRLNQPSDNNNVGGWRHIATCTLAKWSYAHLILTIKSRHSGNGLLTIGICETNGNLATAVGSIRFYGSTDATMYTNAWKMFYNTTTGVVNVYWRYSDYNTCAIKVLSQDRFTTYWNDGEWLTTEPVASENEIEYLPVIYDEEYLPLTGGTLTNTLTVNAPSGKSMFYRANNDTPLIIKGGTTGSFIEYQDSTGQLGYIGVSAYKNPVFNDGSNHALSMLDKNETISGQKTFSKAPHFTAGINRYSLSPSADITTTATNTTWHHQYEDYLDKNGKRIGVIGSVQTGNGYYGVYLQGGNESSLNVLTDGTNGRITTNNVLHLSRPNDASNDYTKEPALVIGSKTSVRLHIDTNEIQAFDGAATADKPYPVTWLGLNKQGGDIGFATNSGGGMNFQPKTGLIPSVTNQLNLGNSTYGWKDIHLKGALYFD